jgi:hypothetical protein
VFFTIKTKGIITFEKEVLRSLQNLTLKLQNSTNSNEATEEHKHKLITRCTMKGQMSNKLGGVQATTQFKASSKSR